MRYDGANGGKGALMAMLAGYAVPHPPLIVPAVGQGSERQIPEITAAYEQVAREVAELSPDVVVVSSPHAPAWRDAFYVAGDARFDGSMARFRAPQERVQVAGDAQLAAAVCQAAEAEGIPAGTFGHAGTALDHATFIPLWFLARAGRRAPMLLLGLSGLPYQAHVQMGRIVAQQAERLGRRAVWIASGDLSHKLKEDGPYGFAPEGPQFDERICEIFASGRLERLAEFDPAFADTAAECGLRSFLLMAGALEGLKLRAELLARSGVFGVGYGVAAFRATA